MKQFITKAEQELPEIINKLINIRFDEDYNKSVSGGLQLSKAFDIYRAPESMGFLIDINKGKYRIDEGLIKVDHGSIPIDEIEREYAEKFLQEVLDKEPSEESDAINPQHYKNWMIEVIDMMVAIYGAEKTAIYCELNAFKYRMRMGSKKGQPFEQDYNKSVWYLEKKQELINNKNK